MPQPPLPKPNSINCQTNVIYGYAKSILTICHMYAVILAYTDGTYTNGTPLNLFHTVSSIIIMYIFISFMKINKISFGMMNSLFCST